jgi:hypothetical protein
MLTNNDARRFAEQRWISPRHLTAAALSEEMYWLVTKPQSTPADSQRYSELLTENGNRGGGNLQRDSLAVARFRREEQIKEEQRIQEACAARWL